MSCNPPGSCRKRRSTASPFGRNSYSYRAVVLPQKSHKTKYELRPIFNRHVFCSLSNSRNVVAVLRGGTFILTYSCEVEQVRFVTANLHIGIIMGNAQSYMRSLASKADSILPSHYESGWYEKSNAGSDREQFIRDYALSQNTNEWRKER